VVAGHRGGHRGLRLALGVAIAGHPAGCGQPPGPTALVESPATTPLVESPATTPAPSVGAVILPGADALLPDRVAGATAWTEIGSLLNDFDPRAPHASPQALAEAFGAAIQAGWAGSPEQPDLELEAIEETTDRAVAIVSETGIGDDSVAGSQYALVLLRETDGWRLDELWTRALCWRGVDDQLCV
jgi:hypothetical protein